MRACNILVKEAARMSASLGELVPVTLCPGNPGMCPPITEKRRRCRRVYLSCSQSEELFWQMDSIKFVIDTGVEKKLVSNMLKNSLLVYHNIYFCGQDIVALNTDNINTDLHIKVQ